MGTADEQIRVSPGVKRKLERRKRGNESYNDVLERVLGDTNGDFYDGFGSLSTDHADQLREAKTRAKEARKDRLKRLGDS